MKQKLLVVALPLVVALASPSADAALRSFEHSGVQCQQADHLASSITDRTQFGIHNTSLTDGVTVECPLNTSPLGSNAPVSTIGIDAYDRSPSADISCDVQRITGTGNISYTIHLQTNLSQSAVQGLAVAPSGVIIDGTWRLRCWIPPAPSAGWFNHIVSYGMVYNELL